MIYLFIFLWNYTRLCSRMYWIFLFSMNDMGITVIFQYLMHKFISYPHWMYVNLIRDWRFLEFYFCNLLCVLGIENYSVLFGGFVDIFFYFLVHWWNEYITSRWKNGWQWNCRFLALFQVYFFTLRIFNQWIPGEYGCTSFIMLMNRPKSLNFDDFLIFISLSYFT